MPCWRVGVVLIVLIFKSSGALTAAYGIAVTGVMVIDTFNAVASWRASNGAGRLLLVICLFGAMGISDLLFFIANSPEDSRRRLAAACSSPPRVFVGMDTWRRGRRVHLEKVRSESLPLSLFLERADKSTQRVAGLGVFLSSRTDVVPGALLHNLKHNKVLHERVVIANVVVEDTPLVPPEQRIEVEKLGKGFYTVRMHHGFFETPDVPQAMEEARRFGLALDVDTATFFIGRETLVPAEHSELGRLRNWLYRTMAGNALSPALLLSPAAQPGGRTRHPDRDLTLGQPILTTDAQRPLRARTLGLTLGALGVVFGDIGTSPLYAMRETALAAGGHAASQAAVYGALSLIFWALVIVVTIKYVGFIMRADNNGEGGVMALAALAHRAPVPRAAKTAIGIAALLGLALFYGDGMLTPAISVLSAMEGLDVGSGTFAPWIVPLTLVILVGLFLLQSRGTEKIGKVFGPVMVLWFVVLAVLGAIAIAEAPQILCAADPRYAWRCSPTSPGPPLSRWARWCWR